MSNHGDITQLTGLFLRSVLDNMRWKEVATVRFGTTGEWIKPNYEVIFPDQKTRTFMGLSHGRFSRADEFDRNRLTGLFSYHDVLAAYDGKKSKPES
jgi:hypothetical protein